MKTGLSKIIIRSLLYHRKPALVQVAIIVILASVITGSLLTGYSVRQSLKNTAFTRMGNTSIVISSGLRYFDPLLSDRFSNNLGEKTVSVTELDGFCQNFSEGTISKKVKIFGVDDDFFRFHGNDSLTIKKGEVAINSKLASKININTGDEIIIRLKTISDIPADAPFSMRNNEGQSMVLRVGIILDESNTGDFSLGISQIVPSNIFINREDLKNISDQKNIKSNRLLIANNTGKKISYYDTLLKRTLKHEDIGLKLRKVTATGETELISDRIFIDQAIADEIRKIIPSAAFIITYLSNSIASEQSETPYSFVSALPSELYGKEATEKSILINKWLAEDLSASPGDVIKLSWFTPDSINQLKEKSDYFEVRRIVDFDSVWSDRTLMPDFPGISGSESCSGWDAGVPIKMNKIRSKDEDYWDKYKGTPKAFISYETGRKLWGNNFGPATAIRFPADISKGEIESKLDGSLDPEKSGFFITDLRNDALEAASGSVDFGTLFISLGIFIIVSAVLLLSLSVSSYFNTKKNQINTFYSIGFTNNHIRKILLLETLVISLIGAVAGSLSGLLVNNYLIAALNSVWQGAVQTSTLSASAGIIPVMSGFIFTLIIILLLFYFKTRNFLKMLTRKNEGDFKIPSEKMNLNILLVAFLSFLTATIASLVSEKLSVPMSFSAGALLFITSIILLRFYFIGGIKFSSRKNRSFSDISRLFYRHSPSFATAPVIFIAAGIFALFITSLNRLNFDNNAIDPSGGTGGYLYWAELNVPVNEDLSAQSGKNSFGLDENSLREMEIIQISRKDGDDASCLNLNHVSSPPLLGIDPKKFADRGAFSFSSVIEGFKGNSPWEILSYNPGNHIIYGIADQTVLQWGLKISVGDTLILRSETGQPVRIVIAAGMKSSVFQGNVLIDDLVMKKYFPSVSGTSIFLISGNSYKSDDYKNILGERFMNYGIDIEFTGSRLASFNQVTNTYLSVFTVLGAFGMILGIFGLGFIMFRNYILRKQEFAILAATGFSIRKIRKSLLSNFFIILIAGVLTGGLSATLATLPSIQSNTYLPWKSLFIMILAILFTGLFVLLASVRTVRNESLISDLRKE
jgi:ABC-type lipoprotein release transport system permease subunit